MTPRTIEIRQDVQSDAREAARLLRAEMTRRGTLVVNLVSSPGAGKTSLLEATARHWNGTRTMAVLVGDLATDRDARRLQRYLPAEQLTTGGACHLELPLVHKGLQALGARQDGLEFLFIENVGNLVCTASHDLGEHLRVVLLSTTEGDDKPGKYPKMFRTSQAMVISKLDLLPHVPFSLEAAAEDARRIQPELAILPLCSLTGAGIGEWCQYLQRQRQRMLSEGQPCQP
jgi:hydrogenase nickel incorporation protein HypB